ncbi:hypothetical protein [Cohnella yongneupensis]|uniref:Uncharacterized protein n=1 Tax=Cohnella yongneupensis TaxID=425006 RepID=A0ABW0QU09_9BACL
MKKPETTPQDAAAPETAPVREVRVRVLTEHRLNFGTAQKPIYKTKDDEIGCAPEVAERLAVRGYVEIMKEDELNGN